MSVVSGTEVMVVVFVCCLFIYYCYCLGSRGLHKKVSQGDKLVDVCLQIILHVVYLFVYL